MIDFVAVQLKEIFEQGKDFQWVRPAACLKSTPRTKSLFFQLHRTITPLVDIDPGIPVIRVDLRIIKSVVAAPALCAHYRSPLFKAGSKFNNLIKYRFFCNQYSCSMSNLCRYSKKPCGFQT